MATLPNKDDPARSFYRERLREAFALSRKLSGHAADEIAEMPEFDQILREYGLGSLDSARRIGEMAVIYLDKAAGAQTKQSSPTSAKPGQISTLIWGTRPNTHSSQNQARACPELVEGVGHPPDWWRDLLNYERGHFLQAATTQQAPPWNRPRRGVSALCMGFEWDVPEIAKRLEAGQLVMSAAQDAAQDQDKDLRRSLVLLFARNREGKVTVVEAGAAVERVFRATNSLRTVEQIADTAGMPLADTQRILTALAGVGAVIPAKTAEEMLQAMRNL